ncbi:nitrilase-related carbon-nitrogen hydrolase [Labedaea rhizosphaerae]|uniref:Putative amidohydrolase n=1 Tax=Labedaea rhizosphaerae TaxID=598644 RepID=A0A4R6SKE2_LABRH|nr:nitrilase-related carbon-nitrogen hydrolase [Labedaea rhizosphaerae]TDQ01508.1 putative amidohydrolase [Labedaea rhizosphaerae]
MIKPYKAALIQQETRVIVDPKDRDDIIDQNLNRIFELLQWTFNRVGEVRLGMISEYSIIGQYRPRDVDEWLALAETIPGPVTDRIAEQCRRLGVYFMGNLYERDDSWPGRLWNTNFIIDPNGEIILKYRKNNGPNNLNTVYTGPGDVYTEYTERYGNLSMFPVVDTEIGVLGTLTCTDIIFPEMSRALALQGAEVLLHPTAEPWSDVDAKWDIFRRSRAYENLAYFLSCCAGAFVGSDRPRNGYRGHSQIIDHLGNQVSVAAGSGEAVCVGTIDVDAIREIRTKKPTESGHEWNQLVELRTDLFAEVYRQAGRWPNDGWKDSLLRSTKETRQLAREIIDKLVGTGKLKQSGYDEFAALTEKASHG